MSIGATTPHVNRSYVAVHRHAKTKKSRDLWKDRHNRMKLLMEKQQRLIQELKGLKFYPTQCSSKLHRVQLLEARIERGLREL